MLTVYLVLLLIFVLFVNLYLFESFGVDVDVRLPDKLNDEEPACPWSSIFT